MVGLDQINKRYILIWLRTSMKVLPLLLDYFYMRNKRILELALNYLLIALIRYLTKHIQDDIAQCVVYVDNIVFVNKIARDVNEKWSKIYSLDFRFSGSQCASVDRSSNPPKLEIINKQMFLSVLAQL